MLVRVLHSLLESDRSTTVAFVTMFGRRAAQAFPSLSVEYVNCIQTRFSPVSANYADLTIVTYDLLSHRSSPLWPEVRNRLFEFLQHSRRNVAFPQDDYTLSDSLDKLFASGMFSKVYTPITENLERIYPKSLNRTDFEVCMTGYYDIEFWKPQLPVLKSLEKRSIDFFSRVRLLPHYLGAAARRKGVETLELERDLSLEGLSCDVSTSGKEVLLGSDWLKRLAEARATYVGMGGASRTDPRGLEMLRHRRLSQLSILSEQQIFRISRDWKSRTGAFRAIGPRFFEAVATQTAVLMSEAPGIESLEAGVHFIDISLKAPHEVADLIRDTAYLEQITRAAKKTLGGSRKHQAFGFVDSLFAEHLLLMPESVNSAGTSLSQWLAKVGEALPPKISALSRAETLGVTEAASKSIGRKPSAQPAELAQDVVNFMNPAEERVEIVFDAVAEALQLVQSGEMSPLGLFSMPTNGAESLSHSWEAQIRH